MIDITDTYTACSIIEGFDDDGHTPLDELNAWAYLIKTGAAWGLQGWYGRNAAALIEEGFITKDGKLTAVGRKAVTE
jgi:hypothetical protein